MKPQDFLLGIRDFFAVLVPGAVLLVLFGLSKPLEELAGPQGLGLLAFAVLAYAIGSSVAALGALFDPLAEKAIALVRGRVSRAEQMVRHERLSGKFRDGIAEAASGVGQPFDWNDVWTAKAFWVDQLRLNCPPAIAELDRLESIQKLFRSLIVVLGLALLASGAFWAFPKLIDQPPSEMPIRDADFMMAGLLAMLPCIFFYVLNRGRFDATVHRFAVAFMIAPQTCDAAKGQLQRAWSKALTPEAAETS